MPTLPTSMPRWSCWLGTLRHSQRCMTVSQQHLCPPLQQMPSACASATDGIVHGIGSHVRSASIGRACRSGSAGLAFAAHFTVQDTEWNTLVTPLPQKLSACTPVTDGMVQRSGSHVTAPDVLSEHAASRHCASLTLAVLRALLP